MGGVNEVQQGNMDLANVVIIGGGIVGCAIAYALSSRWDDVFVLEALPKVGMLTSTRNSGVIHSGIYYPPGSLKARHCVRGNRLAYEFCAAHGVPHHRIGKIVVASSAAEEKELRALMENGRANGVEGLRGHRSRWNTRPRTACGRVLCIGSSLGRHSLER